MGWGGDGMYLCPRTVDSIHSYHRSIENEGIKIMKTFIVMCRYSGLLPPPYDTHRPGQRPAAS